MSRGISKRQRNNAATSIFGAKSATNIFFPLVVLILRR